MRSNSLRISAAVAGVAVAAGTALTAAAPAAPAEAASCYASHGSLYCGNKYKAKLFRAPRVEIRPGRPEKIVDELHSTFSYFKCYTYGEPHSGGNNVWYYTYGDKTHKWGYVPAVWVYTSKDPFPHVKKC